MNYYIDAFITKYIKSHRKDRLKYEINSVKKKENFIDHFCHDTKKYVDERKIFFYGKPYECFDILKSNNTDVFFVISYIYIDGIMMNLKELELYIEKEYMAIVAITKDLAVIKEEGDFKSNILILK